MGGDAKLGGELKGGLALSKNDGTADTFAGKEREKNN